MKDNSFRPEPVPLEGGPGAQRGEAGAHRVPRGEGQERLVLDLQGGAQEDRLGDDRGFKVVELGLCLIWRWKISIGNLSSLSRSTQMKSLASHFEIACAGPGWEGRARRRSPATSTSASSWTTTRLTPPRRLFSTRWSV